MAKSERQRPDLNSKIVSKEKLDLVVLDVLGPVDPLDMLGNQYILTLCDHATTFSYCFVNLFRKKREEKYILIGGLTISLLISQLI